MSNDLHIAALRKGIAVAVATKNSFSVELVQIDAASSIRWKEVPPVTPPPPKLEWPAHLKTVEINFLS
jgi:hypothetical protein